ncbi:hypothetical protein [Flavobacterium sp. LB2P6]|uniref:hypothetical protein n=1 Tax=Flavobacterium sp. LB2P6 TaxID=3401714 RepID=UPI003AAE4235
MADKNTLKNWFRTNLKPTQAQFWALFDSYFHKDEKIPITAIDDIENILAGKADAEVLAHHLTNATAHADLFGAKEDKSKRGAALGYAPLNEFTKLATDYLNVVNDLVTGGVDSLLTAEQGKLLQIQVTAINTLLTSNDINLDTVQELVNAIKTVQTSLSTILVNDLTTGGTTKAATAETVKVLKGLIDALTTVVGNKVDKVAGERLINAGEITKLAGLGNIVTTIKPILSTALASQNVAGMVTYINALTPVLVVGGSEIVKYTTTDTGRVFQLNLRGRSFGVGQPAIVAADVLEVTEFLNKDLKLSNYPNTRNDGQLPTNRVLSTDANGNLKMYTIATAPAPYLEVLVPDSTLPSTTTNFTLKGAFFTPTMTVAIAGQTINYITFKSDNLVLVNVTTGATEGMFSVTLNNGIQAVFDNALLIVLGTVYSPTNSEWVDIVEPISINNNQVLVKTFGSSGTAVWNKVFDRNKNYRVIFKMKASQMGTSPMYANYQVKMVSLVLASDRLTNRFSVEHWVDSTRTHYRAFSWWKNLAYTENSYYYYGGSDAGNYSDFDKTIVEYRFESGVLTLWARGVLQTTLSTSITEDFMLKVQTKYLDLADIKYIELAS